MQRQSVAVLLLRQSIQFFAVLRPVKANGRKFALSEEQENHRILQ